LVHLPERPIASEVPSIKPSRDVVLTLNRDLISSSVQAPQAGEQRGADGLGHGCCLTIAARDQHSAIHNDRCIRRLSYERHQNEMAATAPCKLVTPAKIVGMFIVRSHELMRAAHYPPYGGVINAT
jgi:hypothetical protein